MNQSKKELELKINITFSHDLTSDAQIAEVVENVLVGLRRQAQETSEGICGDAMNGWTDGIEVFAAFKFKPGSFCQTWDVHSDEIATL